MSACLALHPPVVSAFTNLIYNYKYQIWYADLYADQG